MSVIASGPAAKQSRSNPSQSPGQGNWSRATSGNSASTSRGSRGGAVESVFGNRGNGVARTAAKDSPRGGLPGGGGSSARNGLSVSGGKGGWGKGKSSGAPPEPKILFQSFFKSVGPRTYAAQVKECVNGNQLLVLTEGKRDEKTDEIRKTRLFVYGEDFTAFFRLLHETATYMRANPMPEEIRKKRAAFWERKTRESGKVGGR